MIRLIRSFSENVPSCRALLTASFASLTSLRSFGCIIVDSWLLFSVIDLTHSIYVFVYNSSPEKPLLQVRQAGNVGRSLGKGLFKNALEGTCSLVSAIAPQYMQ